MFSEDAVDCQHGFAYCEENKKQNVGVKKQIIFSFFFQKTLFLHVV